MPTLVMPFVFGPLSGSIPLSDLDANFTQLTGWINPRNPTVGPIGSRPAAGTAGAIYMASDQNNRIYIDDGAAWQVQPVAVANQLPEADYFEFDGIGTPATPAAGKGRMFTGSGPSGLRIPSWVDAGGQVNDLTRVLFRVVGAPIKTLVNTTTETTMFSTAPTIKGGTFGTNRGLRLTFRYDSLNNSGGTTNIRFRIKYGGTTIADFGTNVVLNANATRVGGWFVYEIWGVGATNAQFAQGWGPDNLFTASIGVTGGAYPWTIGGANAAITSTHNGVAVDETTDQTFDVTAQLSTNSANFDVRPWVLVGEAI